MVKVSSEFKSTAVGYLGLAVGLGIVAISVIVGSYIEKGLGGTGEGGAMLGMFAGTIPAMYASNRLFDLAREIGGYPYYD